MQKIQQSIVLVGALLVVLMGAYPPWIYVDNNKVAHSMGYAPIWKPPVLRQTDTASIFGLKLQLDVQTQSANMVDVVRLLLQVAVVCIVAGAAVVAVKRPTDELS